jgi:hypothetical protein
MESRAQKPARLPTALGKRPPPTSRVSHSYHSPCHEKKNPPEGRPKPKPSIKKCYLCSRSKVLPMFQVAHRQADEGVVLALKVSNFMSFTG